MVLLKTFIRYIFLNDTSVLLVTLNYSNTVWEHNASQLNSKEYLLSGTENIFTQLLIMHTQFILIVQPHLLLY